MISDHPSLKFDHDFNTVIAGGGIAGLVTALILLEQGHTQVCIVDRDTQERLGGLARWAFGGMALCSTKEQKRAGIVDGPERLLHDWQSFASLKADDHWPRLWAQEYADTNHQEVYLWLTQLGLSFLPAVNWVERGLNGEGNSVPRYHVLWGTGWHLIEAIIEKLQPFIDSKQLTILHQHKVTTPIFSTQQTTQKESLVGVEVLDEETARQTTGHATEQTTGQSAKPNKQRMTLGCNQLVLACGGINGSLEKVRKHWPQNWGPAPRDLLNGANPISDGELHDTIGKLGGKLTNLDSMWNYAAGIPHPQAEFQAHGLSLIPCKSALWLNHLGERIGPMPLVTGFDTNYLCQQVAKQTQPWTWQVLNRRIALKELAVSGSMHNPSIRNKSLMSLLKELIFGNKRLVNQLVEECEEVLIADSVEELVPKMNQLTPENYISVDQLQNTINQFDQQFIGGDKFVNDDQIRRTNHARQWKPDRLRTCKPKPLLIKGSGPLIAIKTQLITRKSLGGLQTNLASQVLDESGQVMPGLYCVGEAAGFGGGGASGARSLEGTFLSGCILTAKKAAQAIVKQSAT